MYMQLRNSNQSQQYIVTIVQLNPNLQNTLRVLPILRQIIGKSVHYTGVGTVEQTESANML
jgi:hypothetical protein